MEHIITHPPRPSGRFWLLAFCTLALTGGATYLYLAEFTIVALLQQTAHYPFGGEGPISWLYQTAPRYAGFTFTFGFLFLLLHATAIRACVTRQSFLLLLTLWLATVLGSVALVIQTSGLE